jgi:hypothetical protein
VYDLFGSLSHVTAPEDDTIANLYVNVDPAGNWIVCFHTGLLAV